MPGRNCCLTALFSGRDVLDAGAGVGNSTRGFWEKEPSASSLQSGQRVLGLTWETSLKATVVKIDLGKRWKTTASARDSGQRGGRSSRDLDRGLGPGLSARSPGLLDPRQGLEGGGRGRPWSAGRAGVSIRACLFPCVRVSALVCVAWDRLGQSPIKHMLMLHSFVYMSVCVCMCLCVMLADCVCDVWRLPWPNTCQHMPVSSHV